MIETREGVPRGTPSLVWRASGSPFHVEHRLHWSATGLGRRARCSTWNPELRSPKPEKDSKTLRYGCLERPCRGHCATAVSSGRVEGAVHAAADEIPQLREPHEIQVHQVEGRLFITVEALVDGEMSVADAHDLSTLLQDAVRARINNVGEVLVHLEPDDGATVDGATVDTPLERPAGAA